MEEPQLISFLKSEGEVMVAPPERDMVESFCTGLAEEILQDGSHHLVAQYGGLLNIFMTTRAIDIAVVKAALQCLNVAFKKVTAEMNENDGKVNEFNKERKRYLRKSLVVAAFLTYKSFNELENQIHTDKQNVTITSADQVIKRSRGKKNKPVQEDKGKYTFWNSSILEMTTSIVNMLSCSWDHLWHDRNNNGFIYMRCFTITYCNILKYRGEDISGNDDHASGIFQILGMLASRAREEKTIVGRLMPLVTNGEDMAKLISSCIVYIEDNFDKTQIIQTAIQEGNKVYFGQLQSEIQIERGFSTFIMELASSNPQQFVKALPYVFPFLESESSTVRSAVLTSAADILGWHMRRNNEIRAGGTDPLRDEVLEATLLTHTKDINANVRSKVLQLMTKLITNKDLYPPEIVSCMRVATKRLMDKGVSVRKQAIILMVALVNNNPFIVKFTPKAICEEIRKHRLLLHEMVAGDTKDKYQLMEIILEEFLAEEVSKDTNVGNLKDLIKDPIDGMKMIEEHIDKLSFWEAFEVLKFLLAEFASHPVIRNFMKVMDTKTVYFSYFSKVLKEKFPGEEPPDWNNSQHFETLMESELMKKKKSYITYLKCCEEMSEMMENVHDVMAMILDKGDPSDKNEVINFFTEIAVHGFKPSNKLTVSVVEAFSQCKDKEKDIDDQMLNQFGRLFLDDPQIRLSNRGARRNTIFVRKLINVVDILPPSQKETINRLVLQLRKKNILDNDCVKLLWDAFTLSAGEWNSNDSSNAVYLLGVIGEEENTIVTTNIQQLISVGFGPRGLDDFKLVKSTCEALLFVSKKKKQDDDSEEYQETLRFPVTHVMFEQITAVIEKGLKDKGNDVFDEHYGVVAELAVQLIYKLAMDPKVVIKNLLNNLHQWVFGDGDDSSQIKDTERLAMRYLSVGTTLLGCHILYNETTVTSLVKARRTLIQKHELKVDKSKNIKGRNRATRTNSTTSNLNRVSTISAGSNVSNEPNENAEPNELDQIVGACGHDADLDVIKLHGENLLESGFYRQFRIQTFLYCNKMQDLKSWRLKVACVKALAKIMAVNADAVSKCSDHFVKLWSNCNHPIVRVEMMRAAFRLNHRFPNQMEKCNELVNAGLRDKDSSVRKAALDFLTYLMLSDLLKARSQLTEAFILTCDENEDVQDMARDFLRQCADKDNILSNAIPDIFSRLNDRTDISQEKFRTIMKYLLAEIKKEKQTLGLVEKIVSRFREIKDDDNSITKYQNAAFCLAQLPINDKTFKIIKDNFPAYSDKLGDDTIHSIFSDILKEARKTFKAETKARLDEFEKELTEAREKCVEVKRIEDAAAGRGPPTSMENSDSEEEDDGMNSEKEKNGMSSEEENDGMSSEELRQR